MCLCSSAAEPAKKQFDIPANAAENALKQLSEQSGREVLFPTDAVEGIRTRAVKGEMTAEDALNRMLVGTALIAIPDAKTGSLTVRRETNGEPKNGERAAQTSDRPRTPSNETEAIVLSPFTVTSDRDTGYQATSTLAGTRLNTPLKDLGASISIYTKDFMTDVGATSANDVLVFATNMEAAGPGGNYAGATSDINETQIVGDGPRVNPQASTRTRGLSSPNFTRNFFASDIAIDSYNTESISVSRGPNAMLFGVGSPAGVVDTALIRPNLRQHGNKVETRFGNNESYRGVLDLNRVLIQNKLAVRFAALHGREEYNQRPAFEEKRRLYGALSFEPFKSTALRASFETGRTRANRPITVLPFNSISNYWYEDGRRAFDWSFYDDPARNPNAVAQNSAAQLGFLQGQLPPVVDQIVVVYSSASARAPDLAFRGVTPATAGTAANAVRNSVPHPLVNRDLAADAINFVSTFNVADLAANFWTGSRVYPGQQPNYPPAGVKFQGFTDFSAFDFANRMLDETSRQNDSFHTFDIAFEQRAWQDRVGIEIAYNTQRVDRRSKNSFLSFGPANHIRIDTNVTLPTGQPNPNLGRPYLVYGQSTWTNTYSERETARATGYLRYDFKELRKSWGRWLGRHTVTGLYEENGGELIDYRHRLATDGPAASAINPNVSVFVRRPAVVVYVGPSLIGNMNPLRLEPIRIPEIVAGPTLPARYFVRQANATESGEFVDAPTSFVEIAQPGSAQRELIKSRAAILQSYWLQEHLITVLGWRRDADYFQRQNIGFSVTPGNVNDPGKVHWGFDDLSFLRTPPLNVAKETRSYSAVLKWPHRLLRLPGRTDFSVFHNTSENFTPVGGRINVYNQPLSSPRGDTREYGFNLGLFSDKLNLRVNRFETRILAASSSPLAFMTAHNNATVLLASAWATEGNTNPGNVPFMNAAIERLFSALPSDYRQLREFRVVGSAPNISSSFRNLGGVADTTDYVARGVEIELVFNPTASWRILANIAKQETVQTNSYPGFKEFMARMTPIWNSTLTDPRTGVLVNMRDIPYAGYPLGTGPGNPPPATLLFGTWLDTAVNVPFATALATEGTASAEQRKWRFNLVTNYSLGRDSILGGRLKGWSIGGAVRWQDKLGIGYPTNRNPNGSVNIDIADPYYAPAETNVDAWLSFERNVWNSRIKWKAQLNVRNLYGDSAPIAIAVQPWGEVSNVRLAPERRWYLTNTFSF